jgi:hypothetical protein
MTSIFVRTVAEGFHCWPDAPEHRAYLRAHHRHLFHIEARCEVAHDDREVEFHDVRDFIQAVWGHTGFVDWGTNSCEQIARTIGNGLHIRWPRPWTVSVSEDNEAGAIVLVD